MSGIAAIIRFDGGPIEPGAIEKMTAAMAYRGPDGIRHWTKGSVALGQCMLCTTAESLEEVQPLTNEDESLVLVMDGWLSNWEELRSELLTRGARLRTRSDAELVLRAYEAWGEDCPRHIDGEFAFLIWDSRRREAYVTHDHIGLKSLHYHWDGRQLVVASDIVGVLAGPGVRQEPNLTKVAEYLAFEMIDRHETIWQGVMRALPAHWMRIGRLGLRTENYWEPPSEVSIRYARDEDYFEHYLEVFSDAVRRTSRTHKPLACDVSGGLDSSAVFAKAHELRRIGNLPAPGVSGYTYLFDNAAGTEHDEIEYARAVAAHVGESVREVAPFFPDASWFVERGHADQTIAGYPNGAMSIAIGKALIEDGCRVILNGEGGDEWTGGTPFYYYEHLTERDWGGLTKSFREDLASQGWRKPMTNLLRCGLAQILPRPVLNFRRQVRALLTRPTFDRSSCLSPELLKRLKQRRVREARTDFLRIKNRARRAMYMVMTDPRAIVVWDQFSRHSARQGYEIRTPMYARKFMEFAFSTPERLRLRGSQRKFVHVNGLRGLLPPVVAQRQSKADFAVAFDRHLGDAEALPAKVLLQTRSKFLSAPETSMVYDHYRRKPKAGYTHWQLWTMFEVVSLLG